MDNRLWANTIRRAVVQGDGEKLRKIAEKLIAMAEDGDMQAVKELGDRLDGKPAQTVDVGNKDGEAFVHKVVREIVTGSVVATAVRASDTDPGGV